MTDREKAIVMAYTGYAMLTADKIGIFYKYIEEKMGRPVMSHELASQEMEDAIRNAASDDFIALAKEDGEPVSPVKVWENNYKCGSCGNTSIYFRQQYCEECGRAVKWE